MNGALTVHSSGHFKFIHFLHETELLRVSATTAPDMAAAVSHTSVLHTVLLSKIFQVARLDPRANAWVAAEVEKTAACCTPTCRGGDFTCGDLWIAETFDAGEAHLISVAARTDATS